MKKSNYITCVNALMLSILLFVLALMTGMTRIFASAALSNVDGYSDVLEDLQKDEKFNEEEFPVVSGDYSLRVIQIAESTSHELYVYVYQPMGVLAKATSIVFSTGLKTELKYEKYVLDRVSSAETLYKYRVKDFTVSTEKIRSYDISEIFRKFDKVVDGSVDSDNTVSEKAYPVGQLWTAVTSDDSVLYSYEDVDVVTVTREMVGMRRYYNGVSWSDRAYCDAHFLAFSTDHNIDRLLSADVTFTSADYKTQKFFGTTQTYIGEEIPHFVTLKYDQITGNETSGVGGKKYVWDRMSSTSAFVEDLKKQGANFEKDEEKDLLSYEWILNFYETDYTCPAGLEYIVWTLCSPLALGLIPTIIDANTYEGELIYDVALLRLEFETDGKIYNLGVVADVQTGSNIPTNNSGIKLPSWLKTVLIVVGSLLLLAVAMPLIPYLVKGIVWIVMLPVKAVSATVKAIKSSTKSNKRK